MLIIAASLSVPTLVVLVWRVVDPVGSLSPSATCWGYVFCLVGALLGHVLGEYPRGHEFILTRLMASMMVRAGLPLAAVLISKFFLTSLFSQGFVYLVVLLYLVGLICEALLSLSRLHRSIPQEAISKPE